MRLLRLFSPGWLLLAATIVIAAYFVFSAGTSLLHSYHLQSDQSKLRADVEELRIEQDELQQIRDYLRTDEYVEFMARRVFGLVKPGETLVTVVAPTPEPTNNDAPDRSWWQRLFGATTAPGAKSTSSTNPGSSTSPLP